MKNRTILAIIASVLALAVIFGLIPLAEDITSSDIQVVRLKSNITRGTQITAEHLEVVSVPSYALPTGALQDANSVIGKYAASQLYAGDYLSNSKISSVSISADDVLESLDGKVAISVALSSFAGSLSGKLENGDIVRFYMTGQEGTFSPEYLQWVKVITTTTGDGIDKDQIIINEDGSYSMPSSVTVLVSEEQARFLANYATGYSIHIGLIYRGDAETAQTYLDMQDERIEQLKDLKDNENDDNDDNDDNEHGDEYIDEKEGA